MSAPAPTRSFEPGPGVRLGSWTLVRELGRGAFGRTWQAVSDDGVAGAVKLLAAPPGDEVLALARVAHPAVVAWLDAGAEPEPYLVLELAPGTPLATVPEAQVAGVVACLADGLAAMHAAGVAHGDVKPDNVVVETLDPPSLRLVDLGGSGGRSVSPAYAAPERRLGSAPSAASDVYALGVLAWELLRGARPSARGRGRPGRGPAWLQDLVASMIRRDPAARPDAALVAATCSDHGVGLPAPGPSLVRRRAAQVRPLSGPVADAVAAWHAEGGVLHVVGRAGSGRTHLLRQLAAAEAARGGTPVMHRAGAAPAGTLLLVDSGVPTPSPWPHGLPGAVVTDRPPPGARVVRLSPLPRTGVEALVGDLLGARDVPGTLVRRAVAVSGGNPGIVAAFVEAAVAAGALAQRDGRWVVDAGAIEDQALARALAPPAPRVPARVGTVAAALAQRVSPTPVAWLAAVTALGLPEVRGALARLEDQDLVRVEADAASFTGEVHRFTWGGEDPDLQRRFLDVVRRSAPDDPLALAEHLAAGDPDVVAAHADRCVTSLAAVDPRAAVALAERLERVRTGPGAALLQARALVHAGRFDDALALALRVADDAPPPAVRAEAHALRAEVLGPMLGRHAEAIDAVRSARDVLGPARAPAVDLAEARVLRSADRRAEAAELARAACGGAPPEGPPEALDQWLAMRAVQAQCVQALDGAAAACSLLDDVPPGLGRGRSARALLDAAHGRALVHAGRFADAADRLADAARPGSGLSMLDRARVLNNRASALYPAGGRAEALRCWEEALVLFERLDVADEVVRVQLNLCLAWAEAGRPELALRAGRQAATGARAIGRPLLHAMAAGNVCDVLLAEDRVAEAVAAWEEADRLCTLHHLAGERVELARRRAEIAVRRGEPGAADLALRALDLAIERGDDVLAARAAALSAVCSAAEGDAHGVAEAIHQAVSSLTRSGAAAELADVRLWAARAWLLLGEPRRASEEAVRAELWAREVGHEPLLRRARALLGDVEELARPLGEPGDAPLAEALQAAAAAPDLPEALAALAEGARCLAGADRAMFVLEGGRVAARALRPGAPDVAPPRSVVGRCWDLGREVVVSEIEERGDLRDAGSIRRLAVRSALALPLTVDLVVRGVLYLDHAETPTTPLPERLRHARAVAAHAAALLATEHARAEQARQLAAQVAATRAQDEFLATVSHELRTPLHAILAQAELLGAGESRDTIREAARRLLGAVEDMLDLAHGTTSFGDASVFDPAQRARAVLDGVADAARAASMRLEVQVASGRRRRFRGPVAVVDEVIARLCDNAVRHAGRGEVRVVIDDRDGLVVRVDDEGPGIPEAIRARVLQPFGLGEPAVRRSASGLGLGLAIVRRHVASLGGTLELGTSAAGGASVTVRLPLERVVDGARRLETASAVPRRILVVDDHPVNLRLLCRMVQQLGYEAAAASGGAEAEARAAEGPWLVVLMDAHMPEVDGLQATTRIRSLDGIAGDVPIVGVTADVRPPFHTACRDAGMDDVATKPLTLDGLRRIVDGALVLWGVEAG